MLVLCYCYNIKLYFPKIIAKVNIFANKMI